jgi:hypothetical protein
VTTENRGVPGSSPGLAIAKGLQIATAGETGCGSPDRRNGAVGLSGLFSAIDGQTRVEWRKSGVIIWATPCTTPRVPRP